MRLLPRALLARASCQQAARKEKHHTTYVHIGVRLQLRYYYCFTRVVKALIHHMHVKGAALTSICHSCMDTMTQ